MSTMSITLLRVLPLRSRVGLGLDTQPTTCMPRGCLTNGHDTGCDSSAQAGMLTFTLRAAAPGLNGFWEVGRAACLGGLAFPLGAMVLTETKAQSLRDALAS